MWLMELCCQNGSEVSEIVLQLEIDEGDIRETQQNDDTRILTTSDNTANAPT